MPKTDPTISQDAPVDSGMDAETVTLAEWLWTNLPTGPRKWTGLPTHEKALVCHTVTRFEAHLRTPARGEAGEMVERLRALHVWPQSVADHHADTLTPRQIERLYEVGTVAHEAADLITRLSTDTEAMRRMWKVMRQQVNSCGCDGAFDDGCPRCTFERAMEQANALAKGGA